MMRTGFKIQVEGGAAGSIASSFESEGFGMRFARFLVKAAADDPIVVNDNCTDHRIRRASPSSPGGKSKRRLQVT